MSWGGSGHYVVDNLPAAFAAAAGVTFAAQTTSATVAVNERSSASIAALQRQVKPCGRWSMICASCFWIARDDVLIARFSETRRRHPGGRMQHLGRSHLPQAGGTALIAELGQHIDTSDLAANACAGSRPSWPGAEAARSPCCSGPFHGFKHGLPWMPTWCSTYVVCPTPSLTRAAAGMASHRLLCKLEGNWARWWMTSTASSPPGCRPT